MLLKFYIYKIQAGAPNEECKKCHDVATYEKELKHSSHAFDKDKKIIKCDQCHALHFDPMDRYAGRDIYDKIFNPEELNRRKMQKRARDHYRDHAYQCQTMEYGASGAGGQGQKTRTTYQDDPDH
jgi:hypothetical protein